MSNSEEKCMTPDGAMKVLKIVGMVLLGIAALIAFGFVIQLLWNWLMPRIFELPVITYWESLGILALSSILFGRLGGGSSDDKKKEKKGKNTIKNTIKEEIKREFVREFEKEYGKKPEKETNAEYEEMYEKWWNEEGKNGFKSYSEKRDEN